MFAFLKLYKFYLIAALWALSLGLVGWKAWQFSADHQKAKQAEVAQLIAKAAEAAQLGAALEIAKIKPIHQTIQTKLQETIRENTIYRECVTDPVTIGLLDAARANQAPRPIAAGDRELSGTGTSVP